MLLWHDGGICKMVIPAAMHEECEYGSPYLVDFLSLYLHPLLHNYLPHKIVLLIICPLYESWVHSESKQRADVEHGEIRMPQRSRQCFQL